MELDSTLVANSRQGAGKVPDKRLTCPGVCEDSEERAGGGDGRRGSICEMKEIAEAAEGASRENGGARNVMRRK